jgi:uncharacterized protein (TIGR02118 family)
MIKLSVFYPHREGTHFDLEYYTNKHLPMLRAKLGEACKGLAFEQGLAGMTPGSPPTYAFMAHVLFDSIPTLQTVMSQHGPALIADVPNYTDIQPILQISEVKL